MKAPLLYLIFIISISITACDENESYQNDLKNNQDLKDNTPCDSLSLFSTLLYDALDMSRIQIYFRIQSTFHQDTFVIARNSFVDSICCSNSNKKVAVLSAEEIKARKIKAVIYFEKISLNKDTVNVYINYPIRSVKFAASFIRQDNLKGNCGWKLLNDPIIYQF